LPSLLSQSFPCSLAKLVRISRVPQLNSSNTSVKLEPNRWLNATTPTELDENGNDSLHCHRQLSNVAIEVSKGGNGHAPPAVVKGCQDAQFYSLPPVFLPAI
jgi:hypothetical protein